MAGIDNQRITELENELILLLNFDYGNCSACIDFYLLGKYAIQHGSPHSGGESVFKKLNSAIFSPLYANDKLEIEKITNDPKASSYITKVIIYGPKGDITNDIMNNLNKIKDILNELDQTLYICYEPGKECIARTKKEIIQFHKIENMNINIDKLYKATNICNGITIKYINNETKQKLDTYIGMKFIEQELGLN